MVTLCEPSTPPQPTNFPSLVPIHTTNVFWLLFVQRSNICRRKNDIPRVCLVSTFWGGQETSQEVGCISPIFALHHCIKICWRQAILLPTVDYLLVNITHTGIQTQSSLPTTLVVLPTNGGQGGGQGTGSVWDGKFPWWQQGREIGKFTQHCIEFCNWERAKIS